MDKIIEGMKFFDELLVEKGKMTRDDFAASRRALRRSYQDEMDKLAIAAQIEVLEDIALDYKGKTIDNIIQQLELRLAD